MRLYDFAYHSQSRNWLDQVATQASREPWGPENKILEIYLQTNFEIVWEQKKVYQDWEKGEAFWRAGNLVNAVAAPLWLVYKPNQVPNRQSWSFERVVVGQPPSLTVQRPTIQYEQLIFEPEWSLYQDDSNLDHIYEKNSSRLKDVFQEALGGHFNEHIVLRTVYAEMEFKRKQGIAQTQWYKNYQLLMPLYLTQPHHVDLVAALQPVPEKQSYIVRTLLSPRYAYAKARAVVRGRNMLPNWLYLSDEELNQPSLRDFNEEQ